MTEQELTQLKKMLTFTDFSFQENKQEITIYFADRIIKEKKLLEGIMTHNTQTPEGREIVDQYYLIKDKAVSALGEIDYDNIGLHNIHVISHVCDDEHEKMTFYFKKNEQYYLIKAVTIDDSYSLEAIQSSSLETLYESLPEMERYCYNISKEQEFLLPFIEKQQLENKISSFRNKNVLKSESTQEKNFKI